MVLLHDFIQTMEVNAKSDQTIFLACEQDQSSPQRLRWADEIHGNMFSYKLPEGFQLTLRKGV